ncbi:hypothetical protein [uncultured Tateyamaria sp.]|uniref:hypothetical protein n=1 Tax=Tateyamaria sp. 1078 TaxID=3417464 RepID=UPI00260B24A0|nr:hypothetical protein [uncultured Tateyamaria sp.]
MAETDTTMQNFFADPLGLVRSRKRTDAKADNFARFGNGQAGIDAVRGVVSLFPMSQTDIS